MVISLKVNLVIFIFGKLHFCKVFKSLFRMLTLPNLNLPSEYNCKEGNIFKSELSNFYFLQITLLQSV